MKFKFLIVSQRTSRDRLRGGVMATLILVLAACASSPAAALAGTLDQQQTDIGFGYGVVQSDRSYAQTFTAGLSGRLDQVDLYLGKFGAPTVPLSIEVRSVSDGVPSNAILASHSVPADSVPGSAAFVQSNFATPAPVAAGTQYAIVTHSATDVLNSYKMYGADGYPGGVALGSEESPPLGDWGFFEFDVTFRTYVIPNAVGPNAVVPTQAPTGQRAGAVKRCTKKKSKKARKKCKKRAKRLPV